MDQEEQVVEREIAIEVPDSLMEGVYANHMVVTFTQYEFLVTFARVVPERTAGNKLVARVVSRITVPHALMSKMVRALSTNLTRFEKLQDTAGAPKSEQRETKGEGSGNAEA